MPTRFPNKKTGFSIMTSTHYKFQPNKPDSHEEIEIGVNLISKSCDIYDMGDGNAVELPNKDFLIFIKTTRSNFNDAFVKAEVRRRGYGKAFLIRSYWEAIPESEQPF